jgi:hypothetical protein
MLVSSTPTISSETAALNRAPFHTCMLDPIPPESFPQATFNATIVKL